MSEDFGPRLSEIEKRLAAIEERNRRVEREKSWETSGARKVSILVLTYAVMCLVFWSLGSSPVLLNAIIPTLGFFLSTLSLPVIRARWNSEHEKGPEL